MNTPILDEIKTNRIEKNEKLFKILAIITAILVVIKIALKPEILAGAGSTADYMFSLIPIFLYFNYRSKTSSHKGQFIKWTGDNIEYKSKNAHNVIALQDIQSVDIGLDIITIKTKDNAAQVINISDYTDYEDRKRIKSNFESLKRIT